MTSRLGRTDWDQRISLSLLDLVIESSFNADKYIGKIEMVQRKAARMTLDNFHTQASVTEMLTQLGWRSLEQRRNDYRLCLFYKIIYRNDITTVALYGHGSETILFFLMGQWKVIHFPIIIWFCKHFLRDILQQSLIC